MNVFGLRQAAEENPHVHGKNMETPHRKASAEIWTRHLLAMRQ